jgi:hypothetical protein
VYARGELGFANNAATGGHNMTERIAQRGFGVRKEVRDYDGLGIGGSRGTPLLDEFGFLFTGGVDHHFETMIVMPDGPVTDLTPNVDNTWFGSNPDNGEVQVMFADDDGNHEYLYHVGHKLGPQVERFRVRDVGCRGSCKVTLKRPSPSAVFALVGFAFSFDPADHHLDEIMIRELGNTLDIRCNDKNDDDVFSYCIDFAWIDAKDIVEWTGRAGFDVEFVSFDVPDRGPKFLSGFEFDHSSGDRHIQDIGVRLLNNRVELFYGDKKPTEKFQWNVGWSSLRPTLTGEFINSGPVELESIEFP